MKRTKSAFRLPNSKLSFQELNAPDPSPSTAPLLAVFVPKALPRWCNQTPIRLICLPAMVRQPPINGDRDYACGRCGRGDRECEQPKEVCALELNNRSDGHKRTDHAAQEPQAEYERTLEIRMESRGKTRSGQVVVVFVINRPASRRGRGAAAFPTGGRGTSRSPDPRRTDSAPRATERREISGEAVTASRSCVGMVTPFAAPSARAECVRV